MGRGGRCELHWAREGLGKRVGRERVGERWRERERERERKGKRRKRERGAR